MSGLVLVSHTNCLHCKSEGHLSRDCPLTVRKADTRSNLTSTERWGAPLGPPMAAMQGGRGGAVAAMEGCYQCGQTGHQARQCTHNINRKSREGCGGGYRAGVREHIKEAPAAPSTYKPDESLEENLYEHGVSSGINFSDYENIPVDVNGRDSPDKIDSFAKMGLNGTIMSNIIKSKYCEPTPVQKYAIPMILAGRDVMSCAQTGSGKTAAFLIPVIQRLLQTGVGGWAAGARSAGRPCSPQVIIMSPTRELAIQIKDEARKFCVGCDLRCVVIYGGTSCGYQSLGLAQDGCNILVATPGRLTDFVERGRISYSQVQYLVLDEADRMLDMGFKDDIVKMVRNPEMPGKNSRRTMMFSATFPDEIQKMAFEFLADDYLFLRIGRVGGACKDVKQRLEQVAQYDKRTKLYDIIRESRERNNGPFYKTLVFVETKKTADFVASFLCQSDVAATSIHGDRLQKEREEALKDFKLGNKPVLVATSVAARGLDIRGVQLVVNYNLPREIHDYVHRIGRTGRVGNTGTAISFYDSKDDSGLASDLVDILTEAHQVVPEWLELEARRNPEGHHATQGQRFSSRDIRTSRPGFLGGHPVERDDGWD